MTDDVKALIDYARLGDPAWTLQDALDVLEQVVTALEAATSAPAVDREELAKVIEVGASEAFLNGARGQLELSLASADAVIAHLGARDVRDVQAETLERYADDRWGVVGKRRKEDNSMFGEELRIRERAQAIREARND